jgi:hypothetical protein
MFSPPVAFNTFIALLEELTPRARIPLWFSARLLINGARVAKRTRIVPELLCDQIMTFLHKDEPYLLSQRELPGVRLHVCDSRDFFVGA